MLFILIFIIIKLQLIVGHLHIQKIYIYEIVNCMYVNVVDCISVVQNTFYKDIFQTDMYFEAENKQ